MEINVRLGLIGLGNMGMACARRLLEAGYELHVNDSDPMRLAAMASLGASAVAGARHVGDAADLVLLSLPTPEVVAEVANELVQGDRVRIVVDLSTTGPEATMNLATRCSSSGVALISSPVSGGPLAAQNGRLAVMASGDRVSFSLVEPVLKALGDKVFYLGTDPSLGQTIKLINNALYASSMVSSCEALVYGVKAGLDPRLMLDVINSSSGRSFVTQERIPQCVLDRSFPVRFTTELLLKDVRMCVEQAERAGVPMFVIPVIRQFLAFAVTQGDGAKDNVATIRHFEQWAGVRFGEDPSDRASAGERTIARNAEEHQ